jgi:hypothetical protein
MLSRLNLPLLSDDQRTDLTGDRTIFTSGKFIEKSPQLPAHPG